jgi:hypothetical protein
MNEKYFYSILLSDMPNIRQLDSSLQKYPSGFLQHKILPEMLKSFEFGGGGSKVFSIILSIGEKLSDDDFEKDIQPVIVRMFASPERGVRVVLLENLNRVVERLNPKIVNDKVFPNMVPCHLRKTLMAVNWIYGCCTCNKRTNCSSSSCRHP